MGEPEASAVPAMVLLSILRREMDEVLRDLSERAEFTQVFNHGCLTKLQRRRRWIARASFGRCIALTPLFFSGMAQVVVFWQPDFPTVASRPVERATLYAALHPDFLDLKALQAPGALAKCELLVLPYGSSVPTDAWKAIETYLQNGGNLLVIGGQPYARTSHPGGCNFRSGPAAGYLLPDAGLAPHLRGPSGARCSLCVEAGLCF